SGFPRSSGGRRRVVLLALEDYARLAVHFLFQGVMPLQLHEMVERKHAEGQPHRRCGRGAELDERQCHDHAGQADLEIEYVMGAEFDLAIEAFANVHDQLRRVRMLSQILRLALDLARKLVELGRRRSRRLLVHATAQMALEALVLSLVVVQDEAAGRRIRGDALDAGDAREGFADLLQQIGIALGGGDLHAHATPRLMLDFHPELQLLFLLLFGGRAAVLSGDRFGGGRDGRRGFFRRRWGRRRIQGWRGLEGLGRRVLHRRQALGAVSLAGSPALLFASASTSATISWTCSFASATNSFVFWPSL